VWRKVRTIDEMSKRRSIRPSVVLGLALGGVLMGHTVTYRLLLPDAHARAVELARSGHAYLAGADAVATVVALVALAALFLGSLLGSDDAATGTIAWRLVAFQVAAFTSLEVLERVVSGSGSARLLPVLLIGLPVQALVAGAIAVLARLVLRAAEHIGHASPATAPPRGCIVLPASSPGSPATRWINGTPPGRAPPSVPVAA
jgi:hypothetical protein